jgi:hypothetical protein
LFRLSVKKWIFLHKKFLVKNKNFLSTKVLFIW